MNPFARFIVDDLRGIHYAVSIFIATTILWVLAKEVGDANPIWAISSIAACTICSRVSVSRDMGPKIMRV